MTSRVRSADAPTTGRARAVRTGVLGGSSLLLAAGAHLVGGGQLPSPGVLAVCAGLLGLVALTVTARRCRAWLLVSLLSVEQLVLHVVFQSASAATTCAPVASAGHLGLAHAMQVCAPVPGMTAHMAGVPGWLMWTGHAVALAATAWLLLRGEAWWWRVADRVVAVAAGRPTTLPRRPRATRTPSPVLLRAWTRRHTLAAPRGPPVLSICA